MLIDADNTLSNEIYTEDQEPYRKDNELRHL